MTTPTCGACFGGHNGALDDGEVAFATVNRNFKGRAGHAGAKVYLGIRTLRPRRQSPEKS